MAEPNLNRTSSTVDRRDAVRNSTVSEESDDEYDLGAMGMADGFRPPLNNNAQVGHNRVSSRSSHLERRSTPPPRPSSLTKPRYIDNLALQNENSTHNLHGRGAGPSSSLSGTELTRSSSISTDAPVIRSEGPYQGPAGPSHPYHMYTQNTRLTRTASIATTSTAPAPSERTYAGPSGPTHPYGLYPQNTVDEAESVRGVPFTGVPVGTTGNGGSAYHRRLGPDGEEMEDMIGPLGHTEQLPPYTQYPDEMFARKINNAALPVGAGGIGLAPRNPEFDSRDDLGSPVSRRSELSVSSSADNSANGLPAMSEKPAEKKWKAVARRKVWGIVPVWVFVLVGILTIIFSIIVGSAVGVILHQKSSKPMPTKPPTPVSAAAPAVTTVTLDAVNASTTPTNMPMLPTGTYLLQDATPLPSSVSCVDDQTYACAWSCQIPSVSTRMEIWTVPNCIKGCHRIRLSPAVPPGSLYYGAQPPYVDKDQYLSLVTDASRLDLGPAWYFRADYDKLVVVPEGAFSPPSMSKRGQSTDDSQTGQWVQPGQRPWFCYWNSTILETFIYASQSGVPTSTSTSSNLPARRSAGPNAMYTMTPSTAATSSGSAATDAPGPLPDYPKLVRLSERREDKTANGYEQPYCQQMNIKSDGTPEPAHYNGNLIVFPLNETEPVLNPAVRRYLEPRFSALDERDYPQCICAWRY